ncbi:MBL fold metallo-hydrolase [candidate division KSB1 bacterium]|nr:MAG: MBL fold metallo-hydrolase [candidate division KSB1 bacterium]
MGMSERFRPGREPRLGETRKDNMKIGEYNITFFDAGEFRLDGGSLFGPVPRVVWNRGNIADENNRVAMPLRCLLIEGHGRKILVDTGVGHKGSESYNEMYGISFARGTLDGFLEMQNLKRDDITDIIFTHLHFDHVGGATHLVAGQPWPTFHKARHIVQKKQLDHSLKPTERDRGSFAAHDIQPLVSENLFVCLDGDTEFLPGLWILEANGHTPGLQMIKITDGKQTLWYSADLLPTVMHISLPYITAYDYDPITTLKEKKNFLQQALDGNWIVAMPHDWNISAMYLKQNERGQIVKGEEVDV